MKDDAEGRRRLRVTELGGDDLVQAFETVQVQIVGAAIQVHGEQQSHQPQIMIAMQVRDEDVADAVQVGLNFHQLHLRALATVDQKVSALDFDELRRWVATIGRHRTAGTEYGNFKRQVVFVLNEDKTK